MTVPGEKIALFIDGANLYATAKSLGFDIDYKRLLREFQSRGYLLRAFYYTAVIEDQEYSSIRPLIDWLDYNGYSVVTKATKEFVDQIGDVALLADRGVERARRGSPRREVRGLAQRANRARSADHAAVAELAHALQNLGRGALDEARELVALPLGERARASRPIEQALNTEA